MVFKFKNTPEQLGIRINLGDRTSKHAPRPLSKLQPL